MAVLLGSAPMAPCDAIEDHGLGDAPLHKHYQVECSSQLIRSRRRRLGVFVYEDAKTWPNIIVHYRISDRISDEQHGHVVQAIVNVVGWQQSGIDVRFINCETEGCDDKDYTIIVNSKEGCFNKVGCMNTGAQVLNLDDICFSHGLGTPMHEILHALGMLHEHTHREWQIVLLSDQSHSVAIHHFVRDAQARNTPYNLGSLMHYSRKSGICEPLDTTRRDSFCDVTSPSERCVWPTKSDRDSSRDREFGQRPTLNAEDVHVLRELYSTANPAESPEPSTGDGQVTQVRPQPADPPAEAPEAPEAPPAPVEPAPEIGMPPTVE